MSGEQHPAQTCAYCGKDLGLQEGYVTLGPKPGTITVHCGDDECRKRALEDSPDPDDLEVQD